MPFQHECVEEAIVILVSRASMMPWPAPRSSSAMLEKCCASMASKSQLGMHASPCAGGAAARTLKLDRGSRSIPRASARVASGPCNRSRIHSQHEAGNDVQE